jgi:DNA-binding Xre family transcriptional regulator
MNVKDAVVTRFSELCSSSSINLNELANVSGVTPSTVYSMFSENRKEINISTIKKLCDGLSITLGQFFSSPIFDKLEQEIK